MEPWEDAAAEQRWQAHGCPPARALIDELVRRHGVDGAVQSLRPLGVGTAGDLLALAVECDTELGV